MLIIGFKGKTINKHSAIVKAIEQENIGGVILFDYDFFSKTFDRNIENPNQVKKLNHELQRFTRQANLKHHRPLRSLLIAVDYEGGMVNRLHERYGFPLTLSAAKVAQLATNKAKTAAKNMAQVLKQNGFNLNFAPVVDLNTNPNNPIIGNKERSFSNNPKKVIQYAKIYTKVFLQQNIQCAYKHFPGHGSATNDSHLGFVEVSNSWRMNELEPYKQLFTMQKFCAVVMTAHVVNRKLDTSGLPATLSYPILTQLLRRQLHFQGVIITDDMQMKAISAHFGLEQALVLAINAGADMLIFGNNLSNIFQDPKSIVNIIEQQVLSGKISIIRINEAYQRIQALKRTLRH